MSEREQLLQDLKGMMANCNNCPLSKTRNKIVFGDGSVGAKIMFVAEAPGRVEDETGITFQGPSGELFNKQLSAMNLTREEIYITNIVRCRPPQNRAPEDSEISACKGFLVSQIAIVKPQIIVTLGLTALKVISNNQQAKLGQYRKKFFLWNDIPVLPTYHPSYLLRTPSMKKESWIDLQMVMNKLSS